jgi:hypothetical protein
MSRGQSRDNGKITNMLGRADQGFADSNAIALNAAISGSIVAELEACLATRMALLVVRRLR